MSIKNTPSNDGGARRRWTAIFRAAALAGALLALGNTQAAAQCDNNQRREAYKSLGSGTYLRDIKVSLPASKPKKPATKSHVISMNKGSRYRFVLVADPELPGKPALRISDEFTEYITLDNGSLNSSIEFSCKKTQAYNVEVFFQGGQDGCCILMLGLMNAKE